MKIQYLLGLACLFIAMCIVRPAQAGIVGYYDLRGTAGVGLLAANEPSLPTPSTASGGEIGAGIRLDDNSDADPNTNTLIISVGWGSSQGFNDLAGAANNSHIHGPTTTNNGNGFTQTAGVLFNLTRSSNLITGGTIIQNVPYTAAQVTDLNNGKHYINIHTTANTGGELRGFIVVSIPEPGSIALLVASGACVLLRRRK